MVPQSPGPFSDSALGPAWAQSPAGAVALGSGPTVTLVAADGPTPASCILSKAKHCSIGRLKESDLCLLHENVSRQHAQIVYRGSGWYVVDLDSKWGTFLNGVRLTKHKPALLAGGDLLRVGPWTLRLGGLPAPTSTFMSARHTTTVDDSSVAGQRVERAATLATAWRADKRLKLVLECMSRLAQETDEVTLAKTAVELLVTGSGYSRGAVLRRVDENVQVEVIATASASIEAAGGLVEPVTTAQSSLADNLPLEFEVSRSLVKEAAQGQTAVLTAAAPFAASQSMAEMRIHSAICVPVTVGATVVGFLYLDARGQESKVHGDAELFCEAVGAAYSLAMANINRVELERRERMLISELAGARAVQEQLLPSMTGSVGAHIRYAARLQPGLFVAGDLLDIVPLEGERFGVLVGDVSGRGAAAGMHMAMVQSFIQSELLRGANAAEAVSAVNRFMCTRLTSGKFVSLWLGICSEDGEIDYVDAGHGHWMVRRANGEMLRALDDCEGGGLPLGIEPRFAFVPGRLKWEPGDSLFVYTDGLIEQQNAAGEQFRRQRLERTVAQWSGKISDLVDECYRTVQRFAGGEELDDDSTLLVLQRARK
jgi:sigma-B regulation protein RsbU (phosphoserine phosphatase)